MNSPTTELELAEPHMREWLSTIGLDMVYTRAEGNTLYVRDGDRERPILDYVGGYGSLMFGHNHPEIVAHAKALLDGQTPVHAQFSRHPYANEVARALSDIIGREFGSDEPYAAIFANSGAEAIEAAVKHAELDRVLRIGALDEEIKSNVERAGTAVRQGATTVSAAALDRFGATGFEALAAAVTAANTEAMARPPLFLALEGSFHGKLMGSVQLTHNPAFRTPFKALGAQARFVPADDPDALKRVVTEERGVLVDLAVADGVIEVVERELPVFAAFLLEPIQGEGGIRELTPEFAAHIQQTCATLGCPVVVDEIQSGMGRSGAFLASSTVGLRGDYFALGKSLGGGIAKAAILLVRRSLYRAEFEFVHSSTFAKDAFSCHIAAKVLQMLEADGGAVYRAAAERGGKLKAALESLRAEFPAVLKEVRGRGLMLGLEFHDQSAAPTESIREAATAGVFGYLVAGYLLREHSIRVFPTASATHTLRFEPSIYLTDEEIDRLARALRATCVLFAGADAHLLTTL